MAEKKWVSLLLFNQLPIKMELYPPQNDYISHKTGKSSHHLHNSWLVGDTLLGINISHHKPLLKMIFLFPRWDMLVPRRVCLFFWRVTLLNKLVFGGPFFVHLKSHPSRASWPHLCNVKQSFGSSTICEDVDTWCIFNIYMWLQVLVYWYVMSVCGFNMFCQ